ncbi:MAG: hypothetical protein L0H79_01415 [Intrasporangium sp.]|uniref:hypothetical protein n=1 Tax=Intrasporangium sp. TaxID=1925024 RepID=UPI0026490DA8|nr:hypothetical protein [Intrasporangium sp.]MDN5794394.1 hypothetical protein [Intrasporangium sp.]
MSTIPELPLSDCGCAGATAAGDDAALTLPTTSNQTAAVQGRTQNPEPGATVLRWRSGTQPGYLESMRRSAADTPGVSRLRARTDGEPAAALFDAWACVLDVLSFYSERAVQEGYLRTATEPRSLVELARTVGYERGPGRAATTVLTFSLEDVPGAPTVVPIPAGTQVASRPGPGETPQTFETAAALDARPEWNAMRARTAAPDPVCAGDTSLYLTGLVTDLRAGDWLLFASPPNKTGATGWAIRVATSVAPLAGQGVTEVTWSDPLPTALPAPEVIEVFALRLRATLFGATAPDWRAIPVDTRHVFDPPPVLTASATSTAMIAGETGVAGAGGTGATVEPSKILTVQLIGPDDWPGFTVVPSGAPANTIDLDGAHPDVVPGSWLVLRAPGSAGSTIAQLYRVESTALGSRSDFAISGRTTRVSLSGTADVAGTFGNRLRTTVALAQSRQLDVAPSPVEAPVQGATIDLAQSVLAPPEGHLLVVSGHRPVMRVADGVFDLQALRPTGATIPLQPGDLVEVAGPSAAAGSKAVWPVILGGQEASVTAGPTELRRVPPSPTAEVIAETAVAAAPVSSSTMASATSSPGDTASARVDTLVLATPVRGCYDRATATVCANAVAASHGETKTQVLGSGQGTEAFQRFDLAQAPLTWVDGVSSLAVRVDGVLWTQVSSLYGRGPTERVYTARTASDDTVTVQFGDGRTGARLPTGIENVRATYRIGTGLSGVLPAGRVQLVMTRPLGVRSASNPLPTGLAADPDDPAALRALATRTVLSLDRAVSVTDFAALSASTPGIAKATATVSVVNERHVVRVSVAGEHGQVVGVDDREKLRGQLADVSPPHRIIVVDAAQTSTFDVELHLFPDPAWDAAELEARVREALLAAFGFSARSLDQPVARSEISAVVQAVPGVLAVTVTRLARTTSGQSSDVLPARDPALATLQDPASLLLVKGIKITRMTP